MGKGKATSTTPAASSAPAAAKPVAKLAAKSSSASSSSSSSSKKEKKVDPLHPSTPRIFRIGADILPRGRNLGRFVRWPRYVRIQRQRKVLYQRLKTPPAINQFTTTLERNQSTELFKLLGKYKPETKKEKLERMKKVAESGKPSSEAPPPVIKFGIHHITQLVEEKKAKLVVIASDVDPIEVVVWLPALCRRMGVPYMIVKNKAKLGSLVHQKNNYCSLPYQGWQGRCFCFR
jgi:large subunit ribosomal protein L7Ae